MSSLLCAGMQACRAFYSPEPEMVKLVSEQVAMKNSSAGLPEVK